MAVARHVGGDERFDHARQRRLGQDQAGDETSIVANERR
jgi:hypothetical protein